MATFLALGILLGGAVLILRRGARRRRSRSTEVTGWRADYTPDAPSRARDPRTGQAERGWL